MIKNILILSMCYLISSCSGNEKKGAGGGAEAGAASQTIEDPNKNQTTSDKLAQAEANIKTSDDLFAYFAQQFPYIMELAVQSAEPYLKDAPLEKKSGIKETTNFLSQNMPDFIIGKTRKEDVLGKFDTLLKNYGNSAFKMSEQNMTETKNKVASALTDFETKKASGKITTIEEAIVSLQGVFEAIRLGETK